MLFVTAIDDSFPPVIFPFVVALHVMFPLVALSLLPINISPNFDKGLSCAEAEFNTPTARLEVAAARIARIAIL